MAHLVLILMTQKETEASTFEGRTTDGSRRTNVIRQFKFGYLLHSRLRLAIKPNLPPTWSRLTRKELSISASKVVA
jgi:hypothetical protein